MRVALPGRRTALALTAIAAVTVAVGLLVEVSGGGLGTPLPPFFAFWAPQVDAAALWAVPTLGVALAASIALLRAPGGPLPFLIGVLALALLARLALAATRDGVPGWYSVFGLDPEGGNEYLPALPALESLGLGPFLDRFAELSPTLPIHPSAHPPGTLLLLDALSIDGPRGVAALVIVVGVLSVPMTYALGRLAGLDQWRARAAAVLLALSPASLLYGVASTDAMFATLGLAALCLLLSRSLAARFGGALLLAVGSFFSWALLAVGAAAAVVLLQRDGVGAALRMSLLAGAVLLGFYAALHAAAGFDPIGTVRAASEAYDLGISNARPYLYWLFGSPVAFFVALGLPISWYAARSLGAAGQLAVALAAIVVVSVLLGVTKAETERIWLFMAPLATVAAASVLPRERLPLIAGLLVAQALASELLLDTVW